MVKEHLVYVVILSLLLPPIAPQRYEPLTTASQLAHVTNQQRLPTNDEPFPSPDGTKLVIESNRSGRQQLYIISSRGYLIRRLTEDAGVDDTPSWSHNGKHIAYIKTMDDKSSLRVIDADGSHARVLLSDGLDYLHPTWSPDDRRILYNVNSAIHPTTYELWSVRTDGNGKHQITHNGFSETTYGSWSPDGRLLVYRRKFSQFRSQVFLARGDGSGQRNLSSTNSYDGWPAWSPDEHHIVFASNRMEPGRGSLNQAIFIMTSDGKDVRLISDTSGRNTEPRFSPDGRVVYFSHCIHHTCEVYKAALPQNGFVAKAP